MMKLLSAASFASLTNAVIVTPSNYTMSEDVQGHNYFFLANREVQHDWHIFSTQCGECDVLGPLWAEIMKCYKQDEKVFVGKVLANLPGGAVPNNNDYWRTVLIDGVKVGDRNDPRLTEDYEAPLFFYGGDVYEPKLYTGFKDRFSLYKFLDGHLGTCCGPKNPELCHDEADRTKYEQLMSKSIEDLLRMLAKMHEKETASEAHENHELEALMNETELIDEADNLTEGLKVHLQRQWGAIETWRRKSFHGIDAAIAAIRRTLDAKGYEVKVDEEEFSFVLHIFNISMERKNTTSCLLSPHHSHRCVDFPNAGKVGRRGLAFLLSLFFKEICTLLLLPVLLDAWTTIRLSVQCIILFFFLLSSYAHSTNV